MAILPQVFPLAFNSSVTNLSVTSSIELPGDYLYLYLVVPTMSVGYAAPSPIYIQGSADGTTFYRYSNPESNTSLAGVNDFAIASATTSRIVYIPNFAMRYMRLEVSGAVTNPTAQTGGFKLVAVSNQ